MSRSRFDWAPLSVRAALGLSLVGLASLARADATADQKKAAGRLVAHALDYELSGEAEGRQHMLEAALRQVPDFAPARWYGGFVKVDNRWLPVDEVPDATAAKKTLIAYRRYREKAPQTVEGQLELADWCAGKKLTDQERAHLTKVIELDPDHADARSRLGFQKVDGTWRSREELADGEAREKSTTTSLRKWSSRIDRIKAGLARRDPKQRASAAELVREINDPAAIPALESRLAQESQEAGAAVVATFDKMRGHEATLALARQAVGSPWQEVREAAAKALQARPKDAFVPAMLSELYLPTQSTMSLVVNPDGRLFYSHGFQREGHAQQEQRVAQLEVDRVVLPGASGFSSFMAAMMGIRQMAVTREMGVASQNQFTAELNERILWALSLATDTSLTSPQSAWDWWSTVNEVYTPGAKPVARTYSYDTVTLTEAPVTSAAPMECLIAGTPVWTDTGRVPIEQVKVGDRVLAQDPQTGELAYKPVLRTTVRPKDQLLRLEIDGDSIESTGGHPFWVAGQGWLKARDLKPGMLLHGVKSAAVLRGISSGPEAGTYNLIVADFHSYFVGESRLLSHDNTVRRPTQGGLPGQAKLAPR